MVYAVSIRKMVTVWTTSGHLPPPLARLSGSSKMLIHRKNKIRAIPRIRIETKRRGKMDKERTVEYCAGNFSGEICLLAVIHPGLDVRRVGVVIPGL